MRLLLCHSSNSHWDFLDSGSYIMDGIVALNDHIIYYELIMSILVLWMLLLLIFNNRTFIYKDLNHGSIIEIIWTILPGIILIFIALPSFRLLYLLDDFIEPSISIKVIGSQWYWNYAYGSSEFFESYILQDIKPGNFRLLDTDEHLILPSNTTIRFLCTSTDVIHSWALPSLGIKTDCIPGRINQTSTEIYRPGTYFGQCSELCGNSHAFMPITLKVI